MFVFAFLFCMLLGFASCLHFFTSNAIACRRDYRRDTENRSFWLNITTPQWSMWYEKIVRKILKMMKCTCRLIWSCFRSTSCGFSLSTLKTKYHERWTYWCEYAMFTFFAADLCSQYYKVGRLINRKTWKCASKIFLSDYSTRLLL